MIVCKCGIAGNYHRGDLGIVTGKGVL